MFVFFFIFFFIHIYAMELVVCTSSNDERLRFRPVVGDRESSTGRAANHRQPQLTTVSATDHVADVRARSIPKVGEAPVSHTHVDRDARPRS